MSATIGVLSTSYPRYPGDPAGRFVAELCGWLAQNGDRVEVLAPEPARSEHAGVTVYPLKYAFRPRLLYGAGAPDNLLSPRAWAQVPSFAGSMALKCMRRSGHWDSIISHWLLPSGLIAAWCGRGLPHLSVAHSSDVHLLARFPGAGLLLRGFRRAGTGLALTSEALRHVLLRRSLDPKTRSLIEVAPVIRMGIDPARQLLPDLKLRRDIRRELGVTQRFVVLSLGRLVAVKGIGELIRAIAGIRHEGSQRLLLVVAGTGPELNHLRRMTARLQAPVRFVGQQQGEGRDVWLRAADLFVAPSVVLSDGRTDSAPVTLLEAMAAGLPVVASDVGSNADLLAGSGRIVAPGAIGPLKQAILELAADPAACLALGTAGRKIAARFTWDEVGLNLRDCLKGLSRSG